MGVVFGLLAALGWGLGDFVSRFASRSLGAYRTMFYFCLVGALGVGIYIVLSGELFRRMAQSTPQVWWWFLVFSLLSTIGTLAMFKAFEHGLLALVSPISSSYSALTTVLAVLSGERLALSQLLGLGVVIVAVILASISRDSPHSIRKSHGLPPGVGWALLASVAFGFAFWVLGFQVVPTLGSFVPNSLSNLIGVAILWLVRPVMGEQLHVPPRSSWGMVVLISLLLNAGAILSNLGMATSQVAIVTVISSLYTAVTVVLASMFLHERLALHQWGGVGLALVGIGLVNLK